jgi:zinc transport system ATP-binding protein
MKTPNDVRRESNDMPAEMNPLVSMRNVSAGYEGKEVLSSISLDIYNDDFLAITGPNGGGKTTLVKIITGLLPYSTGTVEYSDCLTDGGVRRIGWLPQQSIFDHKFPISVIDVVVSGLQSGKGFSRRYTRADFCRARKLLEMTGIAELERRPIGEISGGQMQRTLLCRALIADPLLLILDEPTTYVDSHFEEELYALLRELNDKMAIVIVSHDTAALVGTAKRALRVDGSITDYTLTKA